MFYTKGVHGKSQPLVKKRKTQTRNTNHLLTNNLQKKYNKFEKIFRQKSFFHPILVKKKVLYCQKLKRLSFIKLI